MLEKHSKYVSSHPDVNVFRRYSLGREVWFPPEVKCIYRDSRVSVSANLRLPLRHTCLLLHFLGKQRRPRLSTHKPGAQTALSSLNGGADKTGWHPGTAVVLETKGQSQRHFLVVSNSSTCGCRVCFVWEAEAHFTPAPGHGFPQTQQQRAGGSDRGFPRALSVLFGRAQQAQRVCSM